MPMRRVLTDAMTSPSLCFGAIDAFGGWSGWKAKKAYEGESRKASTGWQMANDKWQITKTPPEGGIRELVK
jgi:hypothetical protein